MAEAQWSNLPKDILSIIAKTLNTDVDRIRLRSVCSSWRASVRPRLRPNPFPLKLPTFKSDSFLPAGGNLVLDYGTLYHLSPPELGPCAGDPSDGWLFSAVEVNPNRFSVLAPLSPLKLEYPPGTIPKSLNLLEYRISEVCKFYRLTFDDGKKSQMNVLAPLSPLKLEYPPGLIPSLNVLEYRISEDCKFFRPTFDGKKPMSGWPAVKKVIVVCDYAEGCEFAVLALSADWRLIYWKFGDKEWNEIDTNSHLITDVAVFREKCYAISREGVLLSLDSNFNLSEADFPHLPANCVGNEIGNDTRLVEYKSDLYAFTKTLEYLRYFEDKKAEGDVKDIPLEVEVFKMCNDWKHIECLGNDMFFSADDYSFGFSVEKFRGLKGNCVYMAHADPAYAHYYNQKLLYGVYDLGKVGRTAIMYFAQDPTLLYWPPPAWLMSSA